MNNKILIFNGSPRRNGNTSKMVKVFIESAAETGVHAEEIVTDRADIKSCRGCLRCNLFRKCVIKGDGWPELSRKIKEAHTLVFATPVYFHHATASMKKILDRFRSFIHVQITGEGLLHTPWDSWSKKIILLTCMGSPSPEEARPLEELFEFIRKTLGEENRLISLAGTRLAVAGQVEMSREELRELYPKLKLPIELVDADYRRNQKLLEDIRKLGADTTGGN